MTFGTPRQSSTETREYISGELRNGDRPTGVQIARHLESVFAALPPAVRRIYSRADAGFYCGEAVDAYQSQGVQFIISARKTSRLVDELKAAVWQGSPRTDADGQCEFRYQPEGWGKAYRFIALRYQKQPPRREAGQPEQYQLFDTPEYSYRVFVTEMGIERPLLLEEMGIERPLRKPAPVVSAARTRLYAAAQLIPLPAALLQILSPTRAELLNALGSVVPEAKFAPISVMPGESFRFLLLVIGYLVVLFLISERWLFTSLR